MSIPTPEQARDLVAWAGGQGAAARAVGAHPSAFAYWLSPEKRRERSRERMRRLRKQYTDDARCGNCGKPRAAGRIRCVRCLNRDRARRKKKADARKSAGLCVQCGEPAVTVERCQEHAESQRERSAWYRLVNPSFDY
jgi:hypothetical protein